jgi:hypothetical protein
LTITTTMPTTTARQPTPNANTMNGARSISQRYRGKHSATEHFSTERPPDLRPDIRRRAEAHPPIQETGPASGPG